MKTYAETEGRQRYPEVKGVYMGCFIRSCLFGHRSARQASWAQFCQGFRVSLFLIASADNPASGGKSGLLRHIDQTTCCLLSCLWWRRVHSPHNGTATPRKVTSPSRNGPWVAVQDDPVETRWVRQSLRTAGFFHEPPPSVVATCG